MFIFVLNQTYFVSCGKSVATTTSDTHNMEAAGQKVCGSPAGAVAAILIVFAAGMEALHVIPSAPSAVLSGPATARPSLLQSGVVAATSPGGWRSARFELTAKRSRLRGGGAYSLPSGLLVLRGAEADNLDSGAQPAGLPPRGLSAEQRSVAMESISPAVRAAVCRHTHTHTHTHTVTRMQTSDDCGTHE